MVEYSLQLNSVFGALSDPIRRDILSKVAMHEYTVGELVVHYHVSFAAISKHLKVMEKARLIAKRKEGKTQVVTIAPDALKSADEYLEQYRQMWQSRIHKLEILLQEKE